MPEIDRSIPIPIYYQLVTLIKQQIAEGVLRPGDRLPTEAELCAQYDISRNPIQRAMRELETEGLIERSARRGTFVRFAEDAIELAIAIPDARISVPGAHWRWPLERAAEQWNAQHPALTLTLSFESIPHAHLFDHLTRAVAEGQGPDISVLDTVWVPEFASRHYLYALDELDPAWVARHQAHFYEALLPANSFAGRQYTIPTNADSSILWYRRDWFAQEGIAPPRTWDDLIAAGQHFHQPAVRERYGLSAYPLSFLGGRAGGETTTYQFLPLLWSAGADVFDGEMVVLHSEETCRTLCFLASLVHEVELAPHGVIDLPWDGALRAFARGDVAMACGGTYENALIGALAGWDRAAFYDHVGFVPVPPPLDRDPVMLIGGMTYGIYRQSAHARTALELITLMLSPSILKPFSVQMEQNAAFRPVDEAIRADEHALVNTVASYMAQGRVRPVLPHYEQVSRQIQEMVETVLGGQMSTEDAVLRAAERIAGITDRPLA